MRISDWSSDVCSSDLTISALNEYRRQAVSLRLAGATVAEARRATGLSAPTIIAAHTAYLQGGWVAVDRKSVVQGKSVPVRVDIGGRRNIEKNTKRLVANE